MKRNIREIISRMTLEEKAGLCSGFDFYHTKGIERLGIPSLMMTDGPHGLRKQITSVDHPGLSGSIPATCFPSGAALACSWDRSLLEKVGIALGEECQAEKVDILLGPAVNIKRSPLCGRNFEYFSEDPYLSSEMAACHIRGIQSCGVGTAIKHFAVNNQEHRRWSVDTLVDERTLREIYLASFEGAIRKSHPWTVMCAYNKVNGEYCSENKHLLTEVLKRDWSHEGFVMSDWGAVNERVAGLEAGLELEMPSNNGIGDQKIISAVQKGQLAENILDDAVERILKVVFKAADNRRAHATYDREIHHNLARKVARETMVLLKNEGHILPLDKFKTIAILGAFVENPHYQGEGSSHVNPTKLDDILTEIKKAASGKREVLYSPGYRLESDENDEQLLAAAKKYAAEADVAIIFAGLPSRYESEGYDRQHLKIPENQQRLIEVVAGVQQQLIVILMNGAPIEMPWLYKVKGLFEAYFGGQALGGALADLLFGNANPCGKLAETFPLKLNHNPAQLNFPGEGDLVSYKESLFVGYRYYDAKEIQPLFPFGYGMSYTTFDYTDIAIDKKRITDQEQITVKVKVRNSGEVAGKEIIQLYVSDPVSSVIRPKKELKGFEKIELEPGEEKWVAFSLDKRSFTYYSPELKDWQVESGDFEILIGKSSREIVFREIVHIQSSCIYYKNFNRNSTIGDLMDNPIGAAVINEWMPLLTAENGILGGQAKDDLPLAISMMQYIPLRALVSLGKGVFTESMIDELLQKLNDTQKE